MRRYWEGNDALRGATVAANASGRVSCGSGSGAGTNRGVLWLTSFTDHAAGGVLELTLTPSGDGAVTAGV